MTMVATSACTDHAYLPPEGPEQCVAPQGTAQHSVGPVAAEVLRPVNLDDESPRPCSIVKTVFRRLTYKL